MSDQTMVMQPVLDGWWFPGILTLLGIYLLWKEYKRNMRFRGLRLIAVIVLTAALIGLFLRPALKAEEELSVVLLTDGYEKKQADSLFAINKNLQFFHLADAIPYTHSKKIASLNSIAAIANEIRVVLGNGLPAFAWKQINDSSVHYISGQLPSGVTALHIPKNIFTNRESKINGIYTVKENRVTLSLHSPAGVEDSVTLTGTGNRSFALTFIPKQAGKFIYQLTSKQNGQTLTEDFPVIVNEGTPYRTLFLQQQPSFEIQYLKSFLSKKNHSVVLRSQLSKNIFRYEYINHDVVNITQLAKKTLSAFDLVILDTETLQALPPTEIKALEDAVAEGLGVIVLVQEPSLTNRNFQKLFPWKTIPLKSDTTHLLLSGKQSNTLSVASFIFSDAASLQAIIQNKRGVLSGFTYKGLGKAGFQLLQSTYPLILRGDSLGYSKIWSPVLEQISRSKTVNSALTITNTFPVYPDQPIDIELIANGNNLTLQDDSIHLPLMEDIRIDDVWHATTWAGNPGWHTLSTPDSLQLPYYISKKDSWKSLEANNRISVSKQYSVTETKSVNTKHTVYKPVSPLIFFLALLLAFGFLWFTPKL
jgi:hypothetical protein